MGGDKNRLLLALSFAQIASPPHSNSIGGRHVLLGGILLRVLRNANATFVQHCFALSGKYTTPGNAGGIQSLSDAAQERGNEHIVVSSHNESRASVCA